MRQFITSGSADEQVPDDSVFHQQFVEALNGEADWDDDGYVAGQEPGGFLQKNIINYSNNTQHPQYGEIRDPLGVVRGCQPPSTGHVPPVTKKLVFPMS